MPNSFANLPNKPSSYTLRYNGTDVARLFSNLPHSFTRESITKMQILDTELFKKQIRNSVYTNNQQKAFTLQEQNDILNALNGITEIEFNKDGGVTKVFINNVEYSDALGNKAQAQLGTRVQNVGNLRGVFFNIFDKLNNGVEITSSPRRREEDDGIINKIVGLFR